MLDGINVAQYWASYAFFLILRIKVLNNNNNDYNNNL